MVGSSEAYLTFGVLSDVVGGVVFGFGMVVVVGFKDVKVGLVVDILIS